MLLILAAHNPSTIGAVAWKRYPILRTLMEMCITKYVKILLYLYYGKYLSFAQYIFFNASFVAISLIRHQLWHYRKL